MNAPQPDAEGHRVRAAGSTGLAAAGDEKEIISSQVTVDRSLPTRRVASIAPDTPALIRQLGRYRIIEKLGEGAMTAVHKAYDPGSGCFVALKLLQAEFCCDDECRTRFLGESHIAGMLSHPNIVTVLGSGEIDARLYIAMELLDGGSLSHVLSDGSALALPDVLRIGIRVANALDYLHGLGIVHGDIKPGNMLRAADSIEFKLADFSIARTSRAGHAPPPGGAHEGTPHYMSPEHVLGGKIDARSDLWAAGVILHQMASGRRPFEADSIVALRYRIAHDSPMPLEAMRDDLPPALCTIIGRCLKKRPGERFQSSRDLADALAQVQRCTEFDHATP